MLKLKNRGILKYTNYRAVNFRFELVLAWVSGFFLLAGHEEKAPGKKGSLYNKPPTPILLLFYGFNLVGVHFRPGERGTSTLPPRFAHL